MKENPTGLSWREDQARLSYFALRKTAPSCIEKVQKNFIVKGFAPILTRCTRRCRRDTKTASVKKKKLKKAKGGVPTGRAVFAVEGTTEKKI